MTTKKALVIGIGLILLAACTSPHAVPAAPTPIPHLAPATLPAGETSQPEESTAAPPASSGEGDTAAGEQVFNNHCQVCHNLDDQLKVGPGLHGLFDLAELPNGEPLNDDTLRTWIVNGGGNMPGVPLDGAQLDDVIAFLKEATQ